MVYRNTTNTLHCIFSWECRNVVHWHKHGKLLWMRALTEYFTWFEIILLISACMLVFLRQHGGFSGGVAGARSGACGERPERSSVPRDHQSGCPSSALVHVSTACFFTFRHLPHLLKLLIWSPTLTISQCRWDRLYFTANLPLTCSTLLFFFSLSLSEFWYVNYTCQRCLVSNSLFFLLCVCN